MGVFNSSLWFIKEELKVNDEQLKQIIKMLYDGLDSAALLSVNKDGSLNVVKEEQSNYSFVVFDRERDFQILLDKLQAIGYSVDMDSFRGLIRARDLIKVDVINKTVTSPMVVSPNHYHYLQRTDSITIADVLNNFDEIVINKNKKLADSLYQYRKTADKEKKDETI